MIARSMLAAALLLSLSGCANSLLYDQNRDQQGQAAVKAVAEAHLTGTVESMSKAYADMAAREEANAQTEVEQEFEMELVRVSRAPSLDAAKTEGAGADARPKVPDGMATSIRKRLTELGLQDLLTTTLTDLATRPTELQDAIEALDNKRSTVLGQYHVKFDGCAGILAASSDPKIGSDVPSQSLLAKVAPAAAGDFKEQFKQLVDDCTGIDTLQAELLGMFAAGRVKKLAGEVAAQAKATRTYETAKTSAALALANAKKAAAPVIAAAKPGKEKLQAVEAEASKVLDAIDQVRAVNDIAASEVIAADKLAHLEALFNSIAGTPADEKVPLSDDERLAVGILRGLPGLHDDADKLLADAKKPRLVPFLAAIDYQKLVLEKIEAMRTVQQKYETLLRGELQAALDESAALATVLLRIESEHWGGMSILKLNSAPIQSDSNPTGVNRQLFYETLGIYGDEVREARIAQAVLNARAEATKYESVLVSSRYAAAQWDALMDMSAKVLAEYHAAGIKQSDLAEFFKALGLVAIGVGVAQ